MKKLFAVENRGIWGTPSASDPYSRQSDKLFLQSSELGLPQPLTRRRVCPPPLLVPGGEAHSLAREGVGESQFRRGDKYCGTLYKYVLCAPPYQSKSEPVFVNFLRSPGIDSQPVGSVRQPYLSYRPAWLQRLAE
jgi:hypothetical protein